MNRWLLTERLVELLPEDRCTIVEHAQMSWWFNPSKNGGYRLSAEGYDIMANVLEFECWSVDAPVNLKLILELEQKLTNPYYIDIKHKKLILFGSQEAMMANLHGNLARWLQLLINRRST